MTPQDFQKQIDALQKQIDDIDRRSIKSGIEPITAVYLKQFINSNFPTQTYSTSSPTGVAVTGSLWMEDTGSLATNKIHVYSGTAWVRMK